MPEQFGWKILVELERVLASSADGLGALGETLKGAIFERLAAGRIPGVRKYLDPRHKRRRRRLGRQDAFVDLHYTGKMLQALEVQEGEGERVNPAGRGSRFIDASGQFVAEASPTVRLGFRDAQSAQIALAHQTGDYGPHTKGLYPRPFMEIDDVMVSEGMDDFGQALYKMRSGDQRIKIHVM